MSWAFWVTSLVIVATPGTGAVLTISAGLRGGHRLALTTAVGCTLGVLPHLVAAVTGTAAVLRAGGLAFEVLRIAGILYLLYMAWATWRNADGLRAEPQERTVPALRTIRTAVLANLLNPKLTLFFFAFLPQFLDPASSLLPQMTLLSSVFMLITLVVFAAYGWFAAMMQRHLLERPNVLRRGQRGFAVCYVALAAKLATTTR